MQRPIGIDLFAGAGGLSLGFEQAGFDVATAVEVDPIHAAAHEFNFPRSKALARSVKDLSGDDIREAAGLKGEAVSVVFGGAPCQGFSLIGQRVLDDPRNTLVRDFVRLVSELDADFFVFENVKGLTVGKHTQFLDELIEEFGSRGYEVQLPWRVLNAADFGVPQNRQRLFLMGARKGATPPRYPEAVVVPADRGKRPGNLPMGPTCRDALADLPNAEDFPELSDRDWVQTKSWGEPSAYARSMRSLDNDAWHFGYPRAWDVQQLTSSLRTNHTEISRRRFTETEQGTVEPISRFFKLAAGGLSNTLRAGTDSARGAFTSPRPIHYEYPRCVTVREMARLHGFPDWFRLHETKWHGARQIGNAVPPPLARAVASMVMAASGEEPGRPAETLPLGDPALLRMGMAEAAEHFGVPVPIGKRDRKSGARKRKQAEIEAEAAAVAAE